MREGRTAGMRQTYSMNATYSPIFGVLITRLQSFPPPQKNCTDVVLDFDVERRFVAFTLMSRPAAESEISPPLAFKLTQ